MSSIDPSKKNGYLSENDLLPSFNAVYELSPSINLRASYGRTLARPTFRELAPFASFSFVGDFTLIGNADLQRTLVDNFDLRWEHFGNSGELYAVSFFYKDFQNPIERVILNVNGEVQYQNVAEAQVVGLEIEARHGASFIHRSLANLQVGGNLSLFNSEVTIAPAELTLRRALIANAPDRRPLQGQSPFLLNLDLGYDNFETGMGVSLFYNLFGRRLDEVSLGGTPDVFEEARGTMDMTFSQQWHSYKIKFKANNLLDAPIQKAYRYQGVDYIANHHQKGRSFSLSLSYNR